MIDPIRSAKLQIQSLLVKIGLLEAEKACQDCRFCKRKIAGKGLRKIGNWCQIYKVPAKAKCIDFQQRAK
jgi:hypothetical protein